MSPINLIAVFSVFFAVSAAVENSETLILLDNLVIKETHSIFLKGLQGKGAGWDQKISS